MLIEILSNVTFYENAIKSFRFPIKNTVRVSISFERIMHQTPSEFIVSDKPLLLDRPNIVCINILVREALIDEIFLNNVFFIGSFETPIGQGEILKIMKLAAR